MDVAVLKVNGMTCQGCVASVTRVLKAVDGVAQAEVTLQPGEAKVTYDPSKTNFAHLREAVEDAGYEVAA